LVFGWWDWSGFRGITGIKMEVEWILDYIGMIRFWNWVDN
jgi:hypothetical protein